MGILTPFVIFHAVQTTPPEPASPAAPAAGADAPVLRAPASIAACNDFYRAVCNKRGVTRDPSGTVRPDAHGEIQALRIYQGIIRKNPTWSSDQVDEALVHAIYTPERRARLEKAHEWVQRALERIIDGQPLGVFSDEEKELLRLRIRGTTLELPIPASAYADEPDLFTKNDVFYERLKSGKTRMRVGGAYLLTSKSWFNIVFTLAHEFAHAIDPCELRAMGRSLRAYDDLTGCFASTGLIARNTVAQECDGDDEYLSEAFADWLAVQVTSLALEEHVEEYKPAQLLSSATNAVRDLCEQEESPDAVDIQFHPSPRTRIEAIFARNPDIRRILGCGAPVARVPAAVPGPYCDFNLRQSP